MFSFYKKMPYSTSVSLPRLRRQLMYMMNSLARNERRMSQAGVLRLTRAIRALQTRIRYLSGYRDVRPGSRSNDMSFISQYRRTRDK